MLEIDDGPFYRQFLERTSINEQSFGPYLELIEVAHHGASYAGHVLLAGELPQLLPWLADAQDQWAELQDP